MEQNGGVDEKILFKIGIKRRDLPDKNKKRTKKKKIRKQLTEII